jgi:hypothetical protein
MRLKDKKEQGATFHRWSEMVEISGTGKYPAMPKGKIFKEHKLAANELIKKGYAVKA